jgi:hypothetical protein
MDNSDLTHEQIEIIKTLWSKDPEFRKMVENRVGELAIQAHEQAQSLLKIADQAQNLFIQKPFRKPVTQINGSRQHRPNIMAALKEKPGMTVVELREYLSSNKNHPIKPKVLNTLLHSWKKEYTETNGRQGVRSDGEKPFTKFYAP